MKKLFDKITFENGSEIVFNKLSNDLIFISYINSKSRGDGTKLIFELEERFRGYTFQLDLFETNKRAYKFFRKMGFKVLQRGKYSGRNMVVMEKRTK